MFAWFKKRISNAREEVKADADAARWPGRSKAGKYRFLYEYLENRYATTVVLTFAEMESLLGFSLPDVARTDKEWWTLSDVSSRPWTLASRTAKPNLLAQNVVFERVS